MPLPLTFMPGVKPAVVPVPKVIVVPLFTPPSKPVGPVAPKEPPEVPTVALLTLHSTELGFFDEGRLELGEALPHPHGTAQATARLHAGAGIGRRRPTAPATTRRGPAKRSRT